MGVPHGFIHCGNSETITGAVTVEWKGSMECPNVFTPNLGGERIYKNKGFCNS
jgi:hypothetical protein